MYRTGMVLRMYRLVTTGVCIKLFSFFIFCKDDSEMLRLSKKLSNFSMFLQRNVTRDAGTEGRGAGGQRCPFNLKDCLGEIANCQKC